MRLCRHVWMCVLVPLFCVSALQGQAAPLRVSVGGGLLFADHGKGGQLSSRGASGFLRLNRMGSPLLLETSIQSAPRSRYVIVFAPCPPPPEPCGDTPFLGPTTALTVAPAVQITERESSTSGVALLYRLGPSVSWQVRREAGADPFAVGARAGVSVRLGHQTGGLLLSADLFRLFHTGSSPRWFLPLTVGGEF